MIRRALLVALAAGLLLVGPAAMAEASWSFVRIAEGANAGAGATSATAVPAAITNGDLIVVSVDCSCSSTIDSVGDTLGNAYTAVSATQNYNSATARIRLFFAVATTNGIGPTVTANFTDTGGSGYGFIKVAEYTPVVKTVNTDGTNFGTNGLTTYDSGSITTTGSTDLLVGYVNGNGSAPATPSGWNSRGTTLNTLFADLPNQAAGSYNFTAGSVSAGNGAIIVAFKEQGRSCVIGSGIIC